MTSIHNHYTEHLMHFYSWSSPGGLELQGAFSAFLTAGQIALQPGEIAVDFGCGAGHQSEVLLNAGLEVHAIDFSPVLLQEMEQRLRPHPFLHMHCGDMLYWQAPNNQKAHLAICWGDTLTHFTSEKKLFQWLTHLAKQLHPQAYFLCSFRDYTHQPALNPSILPIKSNPIQLHVCVLHYGPSKVKVSDILWQRFDEQWNCKYSTYAKIRLDPSRLVQHMRHLGFVLKHFESNRMAAYAFQKIS